MTLTSRLIAQVHGNLKGTAPTNDLGSSQPIGGSLSLATDVALATGVDAGEADAMFSDQRTLAASATEDLDLTGTLTDILGNTVTLARVKGLYIAAAAANTNDVIVGAASGTQWATLLNATGTVTLRPGAALLVVAGLADATGYTVTAGTGDLLKIANSAGGTGVTYDIVVIGASS